LRKDLVDKTGDENVNSHKNNSFACARAKIFKNNKPGDFDGD